MSTELQLPETVRAVLAISADNSIGQGLDVPRWNSDEDWENFNRQRVWSDAIVMGRKTFEVNHFRRTIDPDKPRIVMTTHPDDYAQLAEEGLEFTDETPEEILDNLVRRGKKHVMIAGGVTVYCAFLKANLVDELYVTEEPVEIGGVAKMPDDFTKPFGDWIRSQRLNETGTVLKQYKRSKRLPQP